MASADTRWRLRQWGFATLVAIAPFVAVSYDVDPSLFAAINFTLGAFVLVLGVLGRPQERRCGLLLAALAGCSIFWAILAPVFRSARTAAAHIACMCNVRQEALGMLMYTADFDDRLPLAESWHVGSKPYVKLDLRCPTATSPWTYAMNSALSGRSLESLDQPAEHVLLFEANAALPNASGGREWLVLRHQGRATIGFVDGHAKLQTSAQAAALKW